MGFDLGQMFGQADSNIGNWLGSTGSTVGNWLGGNSSNPGALGTGEYGVPNYQINQGAFQNPYGDQYARWDAGQKGMWNASQNSAPMAGNAATSAGPNLGQYNGAYGNQSHLANQYAQMAAGNGPSMAAVQARQQGQQNLQGQLAAQGSVQANGNPALANYNIGQQAGQIQNQTNQNAVAGRTSEEMGALGAMGNIYGQQAGEAAGVAGMGMQNNQFNAGQQNQFSLANQQSQLAQNQMNNQMLGAVTQNEQSAINTGAQMGMQGQQLGVQNALGYGQTQSGAYNNAAGARSGWMSNLMQGAGAMFGL